MIITREHLTVAALLPKNEAMVLLLLIWHSNEYCECFPGSKKIMECLNLNRAATFKALAGLTSKGLIGKTGIWRGSVPERVLVEINSETVPKIKTVLKSKTVSKSKTPSVLRNNTPPVRESETTPVQESETHKLLSNSDNLNIDNEGLHKTKPSLALVQFANYFNSRIKFYNTRILGCRKFSKFRKNSFKKLLQEDLFCNNWKRIIDLACSNRDIYHCDKYYYMGGFDWIIKDNINYRILLESALPREEQNPHLINDIEMDNLAKRFNR